MGAGLPAPRWTRPLQRGVRGILQSGGVGRRTAWSPGSTRLFGPLGGLVGLDWVGLAQFIRDQSRQNSRNGCAHRHVDASQLSPG